MRGWKRRAVTAFLGLEGLEARYCKSAQEALETAKAANGVIVVWASKTTAELKAMCAAAGVPLYHMEDGFLRSRGLGALHVEPMSLALDKRGIYFDSAEPSDLEDLLQNAAFSAEDLAEAEGLRSLIVAKGLSKYNVGESYDITNVPTDREVVLVPGQVADDASLRFGGSSINSNLDLLRAARERHPDSYVIYKPHPDVETGKRSGYVSPNNALQYADFVASGMASDAALGVADRVVTMTSLIGFEALLRGKQVSCFGVPFYAGWGVTDDQTPCPRRTRHRSVVEILAAAYLKYARYIDPQTLQPITAAQAARLLLD